MDRQIARGSRRTSIHADQNRISAFIAFEHVIVNNFFVAILVNLVLEECKIIMVICLLAEVFQEDSRIM